MQSTYKNVIILGSGMTGLCAGALLARLGAQVTVLERHPHLLGGHARTFTVGGVAFCAGPQFLWNFDPQEPSSSYRILRFINPEKSLAWEHFDPTCQDRVFLGDRQPIDIPLGLENFRLAALNSFPADREGLELFFEYIQSLFLCAESFHDQGLYLKGKWSMLYSFLTSTALPLKMKWQVGRMFDKRLSDLFNLCQLSEAAQRFLYAQSGIFAENVDELSIGVYASAVGYCARGISYPAGGLASITDFLVQAITTAGGQALLSKEVTELRLRNGHVEAIACVDGTKFDCDLVISTLSPRNTCRLLPGCRLERFTYQPSQSLVSTFLTVRNYPGVQALRGKNFWWQSMEDKVDYNQPDITRPPTMMYLGSQTANGFVNSGDENLHGLTLYTPGNFAQAAQAHARGEQEHESLRQAAYRSIIACLEQHIFPGIGSHVEAYRLLTPWDLYVELGAEEGNVYGRRMDVKNVLREVTPIGGVKNLEVACATIGLPGLETCFQTSALLVQRLTGVKI